MVGMVGGGAGSVWLRARIRQGASEAKGSKGESEGQQRAARAARAAKGLPKERGACALLLLLVG